MAKNYIKGSFKELPISGTDDTRLIISVSVADLDKIKNEKGYAPIVIQRRRESDAFGNTHYAFENDYNPEEAKKAGSQPKPAAKLKAPTFKEDLDSNPFG